MSTSERKCATLNSIHQTSSSSGRFKRLSHFETGIKITLCSCSRHIFARCETFWCIYSYNRVKPFAARCYGQIYARVAFHSCRKDFLTELSENPFGNTLYNYQRGSYSVVCSKKRLKRSVINLFSRYVFCNKLRYLIEYCVVFIEQKGVSHGKSNSNYGLFAELFAESRSTNSANNRNRWIDTKLLGVISSGYDWLTLKYVRILIEGHWGCVTSRFMVLHFYLVVRAR